MPKSSSPNPRILITNDDGIAAEGLKYLEKIARTLSDDVWVVAPETEQSGVGHSLTLHTPVRVRRIEEKRFAVMGTPTDCVLLAIKELIPAKKKVSLILSGVNRGSNVADDVTYSGTIAAAMEGAILGVPSIALSQMYDDADAKQHMHWETPLHFAPKIIAKLIDNGWPKNTLINLNFPARIAQKTKGIKVCSQGKRLMNVKLHERMDPKGRPYFWLGGERDNTPEKPNVDVDFLHQGYITITPIDLDLTDYKTLAVLDTIF